MRQVVDGAGKSSIKTVHAVTSLTAEQAPRPSSPG
jgi:hypothetical protein